MNMQFARTQKHDALQEPVQLICMHFLHDSRWHNLRFIYSIFIYSFCVFFPVWRLKGFVEKESPLIVMNLPRGLHLGKLHWARELGGSSYALRTSGKCGFLQWCLYLWQPFGRLTSWDLFVVFSMFFVCKNMFSFLFFDLLGMYFYLFCLT